MTQTKKVKNQLLASKISVIRSLNNEQALKYELTQFFQNLKKTVLHELEEYYNEEFMFQGQADLILAPIFEAQQEYYNILRKFNHKEYNFGRKTGRRLVELARGKHVRAADKSQKPSILNTNFNRNNLFGTNQWSEQELLNRTFTASERTMNRVDSDINKILSDGYREGKGINSVRNDIVKRFDQLSSWEAQRIARTEIHNAHNMGTMNIYQEMGVEYVQWIAAHDARTRTSHIYIDGEIIPLGGTFSNRLRFPGDTTGKIAEWVNCRCSLAPFIIPYGYAVPDRYPFRESDLILTLDARNQIKIINQFAGEYISNEFHLNLSPTSKLNTIKRNVTRNIKEKFINTPEKTAKYFKLEHKDLDLNYHQFVDKKHGCTIAIEKSLTQGENIVISMKNNGKSEINLMELLRTYSEAPSSIKNPVDKIIFMNSGGKYDLEPGYWKMKNGESVVYIKTKTALNEIARGQCPIQRTILHEMGHGGDLNDIGGLLLSKDPVIIELINAHGFSSDYAARAVGALKYKEEIADAISMVSYKHKHDKSTAVILSPVYDENKKIVGRELRNYYEWHEKYNELATYLEKKLDL